MKSTPSQFLLSSTAALFALVGCSDAQTKPSPVASQTLGQPINVALNVNVTTPDPKKIVVRGVTNLPDDFIMTVGMCRYSLDTTNGKKYCITHNEINPSEQYIPVKNGKFETSFTVPTSKELKTVLIRYGKEIKDPKVSQYQPEKFVSLEVVGTPKKQTPEILALIGGDSASGLQGTHTELALNTFRIVKFESKIKI